MSKTFKEIKDIDINFIINSSAEDLEKLSQIELMVICEIIRFRKSDDWKVKIPVIENLLNSIHYIFNVLSISDERLKKLDNKYSNSANGSC